LLGRGAVKGRRRRVARLSHTLVTPSRGETIREELMLSDPDRNVMEKAYARWAPIYDALCGPVFVNGRRAAARAAREAGGRILEIGVGTGLSFDDYDEQTEITGIDISEPMIARARMRANSGRYPFVRELSVMDAHAFDIRGCVVRLCRRPVCHHAC
jgi:SAM-dependent methyltransferase